MEFVGAEELNGERSGRNCGTVSQCRGGRKKRDRERKRKKAGIPVA
jgi:hypothetical protein